MSWSSAAPRRRSGCTPWPPRRRWAPPLSATWTPTPGAARSPGNSGPRRCTTRDPGPRRFPRAAITVSNTSDPQGLATALRSTDDYGICTCTAIFFGHQPSLPLLDLYTKGITVHLSRADSRRYTPEVADLAASGRLNAGAVTTRTAGWDDAPAAWLASATKLVLVRD